MTPNPEKIDSSLIVGVLTSSSQHLIDPEQIELKDHLQLADNVEFPFIVIGSEVAKQESTKSFVIRVFIRFPTGRMMTLIEHFIIQIEDCNIEPHVAGWCETKGPQQLELLANFIGQYLNIEIEETDQNCVKFKILGKIVQPKGHSRDSGLTVTKPKQDIHGLFTQPHPA